MNTAPQPLDHRAFLQQYVLAMAAGREYGTPRIRVEEAHEAWQAIEKSVKAAQESQKAKAVGQALLRKGAVKTSDRLPYTPDASGYRNSAGRLVQAFSREKLHWELTRAGEVFADAYVCWVENP